MNEIYGGENSIVRHWLSEPWNMDGWRLDVVHMLGEAGGARNNLQHVAGITRAAKAAQLEAFVFGEHFGDARQWLQADAEDAAMNYRGFTFPLWGFLANTDISYDRSILMRKPAWRGWITTAPVFRISSSYGCLTSWTAMTPRDSNPCSVRMSRACRWR